MLDIHVMSALSGAKVSRIGFVAAAIAEQPHRLGQAAATARVLESRSGHAPLGLHRAHTFTMQCRGLQVKPTQRGRLMQDSRTWRINTGQ